MYFKTKNWPIAPYELLDRLHWKSIDLEIKVTKFFHDSAIKTINVILRIPSIIRLDQNIPIYGFYHVFRIIIPREYPVSLHKIKILNDTELFHPHFSIVNWSHECGVINRGEIDRVLIELIFHILFDPDRINPPSFFPNETIIGSINQTAMNWYDENDPYALHKTIMEKWDDHRKKLLLKETFSFEDS
jgi:hypothetical protein